MSVGPGDEVFLLQVVVEVPSESVETIVKGLTFSSFILFTFDVPRITLPCHSFEVEGSSLLKKTVGVLSLVVRNDLK